MDIGSLIGNPVAWLVVAFILLAILYALRSYFTALLSSLFYDYVVDGALSFADNFVAGAGLVGFDIGDWIAGIIIFMRYYKQLGKGWALICALEAANFGLSLIPGIGEPIEWFFNFFPIITIVVMIKQYNANTINNSIQEYYNYIQNEDNDAAEQWKGAVDKIKQYYDSLDYENLGKEGKGIAEGLHAEAGKNIMKKLNTAQKYIIDYLEEQANARTGIVSADELNSIRGAIERAIQDIDTDWRTADTEANQILQSVSSLVYAAQKSDTMRKAA